MLADAARDADQEVGGWHAPRVDHEHAEEVTDGALRLVLVDDLGEAVLAIEGHGKHLLHFLGQVGIGQLVRRRQIETRPASHEVGEPCPPVRVGDEELVQILVAPSAADPRPSMQESASRRWRQGSPPRWCRPP